MAVVVMGDFKELKVWRDSHAVVMDVYRLTGSFPASERFGLVSQMRRAAVSVSSNVAESRGRYSVRDQARFLQVALGSAAELECQLLISRDLRFSEDAVIDLISARLFQVRRMLGAMCRDARRDYQRPRPKV